MNKLFTWLVGLANPLWRRLGADPNALRLILTAKLIMDDRGGAVMGRRQTQKKGMEWFLYLMLFLFGCGLVILPYWMTDKATAIGLVYSVWMIYIGLLLELAGNTGGSKAQTIIHQALSSHKKQCQHANRN